MEKQFFSSRFKNEKKENVYSTNSSSNYSTCSDFNDTTNSTILAGHINCSESIYNETVGLLDKAFDEDQFTDCDSDFATKCLVDDSTEYKDLKLSDNRRKNSSSSNSLLHIPDASLLNHKLGHEFADLITIMEETEITHKSTNSMGKYSMSNLEDASKHNNEESLFYNNKFQGTINVNRTKVKIIEPKTLSKKHSYKKAFGKNMDENFNIHSNDTESFLLWENLLTGCQTLNTTLFTKSLSCSNLSSTLPYEGDIELSTSLSKDYDNFCDSTCYNFHSNKSLNETPILRSKSCNDLLKEVKHLPHILYDKLLRSLSKEIKHLRKEHPICNCYYKDCNSQQNENKPVRALKSTSAQQISSEALKKDRTAKIKPSTKIAPKILSSSSSSKKNPAVISPNMKIPSQVSPLDRNKKSPMLLKTENPQKKYLVPTNAYSLRKEIISPVKEYIEGRRPAVKKNITSFSQRL